MVAERGGTAVREDVRSFDQTVFVEFAEERLAFLVGEIVEGIAVSAAVDASGSPRVLVCRGGIDDAGGGESFPGILKLLLFFLLFFEMLLLGGL